MTVEVLNNIFTDQLTENQPNCVDDVFWRANTHTVSGLTFGKAQAFSNLTLHPLRIAVAARPRSSPG